MNHVPLNEFAQRAKNIGVSGNVKKLFKDIDTANKGFITLEDLDREANEEIVKFQEKALERYGNLAEAAKALDVDGNGRVDEEDFLQGVASLGYAPNDAKRLFALLRPERGRPFFCPKDLKPLSLAIQSQALSSPAISSPAHSCKEDSAGESSKRVGSAKGNINGT
jgi:Ca2+-binding EF-hand superfamily protein